MCPETLKRLCLNTSQAIRLAAHMQTEIGRQNDAPCVVLCAHKSHVIPGSCLKRLNLLYHAWLVIQRLGLSLMVCERG